MTNFKASWVYLGLCIWLFGCASLTATRPNPILTIPCPDDLSQSNPLLCQELARLPEVQDGISDSERKAIRRIADLYRTDPAAFDSVFKRMYRIGLPLVRKYNSPLQALFWIAEEEGLAAGNSTIKNYSLNGLLDRAWRFDNVGGADKEDVISVLKEMHDQRLAQAYQAALEEKTLSISNLTRMLLTDLRRNPWTFTSKGRRTLKQLKKSLIHPKWRDFNTVVERLNAPELVDYYERKRFRYVDWRSLPSPSVSPKWVFEHNIGHCRPITRFTVHCLQRAGYKAREIHVESYSGLYDFHALTLFEAGGKKYLLDNGLPVGRGILPFEDLGVAILPFATHRN
ncbi:MAG: hypothetical protein JRI76_14045 [Deltaproteobacteria bacterium]|nr:hypothetical protein [Deltaproteobacteria bacterium]MBW2133125.1 hypothetical protein [Deltaproteobacteria bacterium]